MTGVEGAGIRALVVLERYPQLSETYIATEVAALERAGLLAGVLAMKDPDLELIEHVPFVRIQDQRDMVRLCAQAQPTVLHTHYLHMAPLLQRISEATGLPFTVRTHSYDVLMGPKERLRHTLFRTRSERLKRICAVLNESNCIAVLGFPFVHELLRDHGLRDDLIHRSWPVIDFDRFLDRGPNGDGVLNLGAALEKKNMKGYIEFAASQRQLRFSLYPVGYMTQELLDCNTRLGSPVDVRPAVQPAEMPAVYKSHNWLVYSASLRINMVGWPMAVAEAQASGLGVCLQTNRPDAAEYLDGAGVAFRNFREIVELIAQPVPQAMRERGFEVAARSDVERHLRQLREIWLS